MSNPQEINHEGVIKSIKDNIATVEILQKSSCASCELTGACNMSESTIKEVDVPLMSNKYAKGDKVDIVFTREEGFKALLIGYVLPFVVMILAMVVSKIFWESDLIVGLLSIGVLSLYYLILFLLKNKIRTLFEFRLKK